MRYDASYEDELTLQNVATATILASFESKPWS